LKLFTEFWMPVPVASLNDRNHGPPLDPPVWLHVMPMPLDNRKSLNTRPLQ
jgi:hypothetical protein